MIAITRARLFELFSCDPDTGLFVRRVSRGNNGGYRVKAGDIAGSINSKGYIQIKIDGRTYQAHRLAWLYVTGEWPANQIDHIDGNRANNCFDNLREATNAENGQNLRQAHRHNFSGLLGVSWYKKTGKWKAEIMIDGKNQYLGLFPTAELAHAAYLAEKRELHPFGML